MKWIKVRAQAKNIEDITTVGWDVEQWNTQAKANKLFVGMKRINSAMYDARKRLENAGYIKLLKPKGDKKLTLAYVCHVSLDVCQFHVSLT